MPRTNIQIDVISIATYPPKITGQVLRWIRERHYTEAEVLERAAPGVTEAFLIPWWMERTAGLARVEIPAATGVHLVQRYPVDVVEQVLAYIQTHYTVADAVCRRCPHSLTDAFLTDWLAATNRGLTLPERPADQSLTPTKEAVHGT